MAIVCAPINGVGLGHVTRCARICQSLLAMGYRPVITAIGHYPENLYPVVPGVSVSSLVGDQRHQLVQRITKFLNMSQPAVLIEDTNPLPVEICESVTRILIVRPTMFSHLQFLRYEYSNTFARVLVADAPGSPTWPYSEEETAEIGSWRNWHCLGPVFRTPTQPGIEAVRRKYNLNTDQRLYVMTMGAGGHQPGCRRDISTFLDTANSIGAALRAMDPSCRLLFVRGPLFPLDASVPPLLEAVDEEPGMPELLSQADGAVIRPGFNTLWECLHAGTPFVAVEGTTYQEPVRARLARAGVFGLWAQDDTLERWKDVSWRSAYRKNCIGQLKRWTGEPDRMVLGQAIASAGRRLGYVTSEKAFQPVEIDKSRIHAVRQRCSEKVGKKGCFHLRVDDVVDLDEPLSWILKECARRNVPVSLCVVPYLSSLSDAVLDECNYCGPVEILQHGYAHLPQVDTSGTAGEYIAEREPIPTVVSDAIKRGHDFLVERFPTRFCGGYAPPYDGLPRWLPSLWRSIGGRYVSTGKIPLDTCIPVVTARVDLWNWRMHRPRPVEAVWENMIAEFGEHGYAGIIAHPELLTEPAARGYFVGLLDVLAGAGIEALESFSILNKAAPHDASSRLHRGPPLSITG